jgi:hypothetical protein
MTTFDWTRSLARGAKPRLATKVRNDVPVELQAVALLREDCSKVDIEHATELFALLVRSPSGREDVELMVEHKIPLAFDTRKGGAGYQPHLRLVILNRTQVAARTAIDFVHEITHARFHVTNTGCNIEASKEQYVRGILFEESHTYFREALVGRELVHVVRDPRIQKALFTKHTLQMWFQVVHGVPYQKAPSAEVLDADAALDGRTIAGLRRDLHPYFARYVEFYRNVEAAKWEIRHGLRRRERPEVIADVLSMCASEQDQDWTYPKRRVR